MAFIGLHYIIRENIFNAKRIPSNTTSKKWEEMCDRLKDEDSYDNEIRNIMNRISEKNKLLNINERVKNEYLGLREYRNNCAHGKSSTIGYYNVELLWHFIMDNYTSFSLVGGIDYVLDMVRDHYDYSKTAPGEPVDYLINAIRIYIDDDNYITFFEELYKLIYEIIENKQTVTSAFSNNNPQCEIWNKLLVNMETREFLIKYIKELDLQIIVQFVYYHPEALSDLFSDESFARPIWKERIFSIKEWKDGVWLIIKFFIDNDYIPYEEKDEFNNKLYDYYKDSFSNDQVETLNKTDFSDRFRKEVFDTSNYGISYANVHANSFVNFISWFGLDVDSVKCINKIFKIATYGWFYESIQRIMNQNNELFEKYKSIVNDNGLEDYSKLIAYSKDDSS